MNKFNNSLDFDIECPTCKKSIHIKTSDIGTNINCPRCNVLIELHNDNSPNSIEEVNNELDNLFNTLNLFE
ncbi:MAG: hypothetical protein IJH12_07045 [Clostridia bacterium]|nr:hypothetical protein [Clostridia bacterium]